MNILFIHSNYPAQFQHLARSLGSQSQHDVRFLTAREDAHDQPIAGINIETFKSPAPNESLNGARQVSDHLIQRGFAVQAQIIELINKGFTPRLIIFHGGNGLGLLLKTILPDATLIGYFEWYFSNKCSEVLLGQTSARALAYTNLRNLVTNQELVLSDSVVVPTSWQAKQFPDVFQTKINIAFDGINCSFFNPGPPEARHSSCHLAGEDGEANLNHGQPLLTYATRGMEPLRGFPEFMRSLPHVMQHIPDAHVIIAGRDRSAYGGISPKHGGSWKKTLLEELGDFDGLNRIHFLGLMTYAEYRKLLRRTNLHCYFTRPFVTSWSLFEALACGSPLLVNHSPAITGLFPSLRDRAIDLDQEPASIAETIVTMLKDGGDSNSGLPDEFGVDSCARQWQEIINTALAQGNRKP